jgi:endonuclease YncB( thermonuclease family)
MPMLCLAGTYRIVDTEPDGDSIRFYPDDPSQWSLVGGHRRVRANAGGGAQLRLDGIDALETHYTAQGGGERLHQPLVLAHDAAAELLRWLGFKGVQRDVEKVVAADPAKLAGYLLTRTADIYGRCVALVGRGDAPVPSGTQLRVNVAQLRRTGNFRLLTTGLAYPTFYTNLFPDLRRAMVAEVARAQPDRGVWPSDRTEKGFEVTALETLTDDVVIMPKLFRRLVDYLHLGDGDPSLAGFASYLEQRDDRVIVMPEADFTSFDTVVRVDGQAVRLTTGPENLVFQEA